MKAAPVALALTVLAAAARAEAPSSAARDVAGLAAPERRALAEILTACEEHRLKQRYEPCRAVLERWARGLAREPPRRLDAMLAEMSQLSHLVKLTGDLDAALGGLEPAVQGLCDEALRSGKDCAPAPGTAGATPTAPGFAADLAPRLARYRELYAGLSRAAEAQ